VLLIFAGLLAARGSDKEDEMAMKAAEEAPELEVEAAKAENGDPGIVAEAKAKTEKAELALMTWVFNRKLAIDPFSLQNSKARC